MVGAVKMGRADDGRDYGRGPPAVVRNGGGGGLPPEFGHILGLVSNGTTMQDGHREKGRHCDQQQRVMPPTLETTDVFSSELFDGTVPSVERLCTDDRAAQRDG